MPATSFRAGLERNAEPQVQLAGMYDLRSSQPGPPTGSPNSRGAGVAARSLAAALIAMFVVLGVRADVVDAGESGHRRLVSDVAWLPADVDLVIAADGAGVLVRPPFAPLLLDLSGQGVPMTATMAAWGEFARLLRMESVPAFDAVLADRFVFAARRVRGEPKQVALGKRNDAERRMVAEASIDGDRVEWVIVTLVDDGTARRLTQALRAAPRGVRNGRPLLVLEGGSFTLDLRPSAQRGKSWMSMAPAAASGLFDLARRDGPGARINAPGGMEQPPGRIGTDHGFDSIRAMARSFRSPLDEPGALAEMAIAAEVAGEFAQSRLFVYARFDGQGGLRLTTTTEHAARSDDWIALFGETTGDTLRIDALKRLEAIFSHASDFHPWPAATFDALADGALAAGMIAGPALRDGARGGQFERSVLAGISEGGALGMGVFGGVAEQLGLPVTRLAWTISDRGGSFDAAIALETAAVDGLVAQGDAFMQAMLTPVLGKEPEVHQGVAVGAAVNDHSMRVIRMPRPIAWVPKDETAATGERPDGTLAWTFRVCPIAARADEECPSAWWTVGLSPQLVAATTDRLTEEHLGLPQRWIALQVIRPRALATRMELTGIPTPPGLRKLERVELFRWREALLPNGLTLGQGLIEAAADEVVDLGH